MRIFAILICCLSPALAFSMEEIELNVDETSVEITDADITNWADDSIPSSPSDLTVDNAKPTSDSTQYTAPATYFTSDGGRKNKNSYTGSGDSLIQNSLLGKRYFGLGTVNIPNETIRNNHPDVDRLDIDYGYPVILELNVPVSRYVDISSFIRLGTDTVQPSKKEYQYVSWKHANQQLGLSITGYLPSMNRIRPFMTYGLAQDSMEVTVSTPTGSQVLSEDDRSIHHLAVGGEVDVNKRVNIVGKVTEQDLLEDSFRLFTMGMNYWISPIFSVNLALEYNNLEQRWVGLAGTRISL